MAASQYYGIWDLDELYDIESDPQQMNHLTGKLSRMSQIYEDPPEQWDLPAQFSAVFNELLAILRAQPIGSPDRLA